MSIGKVINGSSRSKTQANFNRKDFQAAQGQTIFEMGDFLLTEESIVYVNGSPVNPGSYTGTGTTILQFLTPRNEFDQVIIIS